MVFAAKSFSFFTVLPEIGNAVAVLFIYTTGMTTTITG
jgi:hypothetical protein